MWKRVGRPLVLASVALALPGAAVASSSPRLEINGSGSTSIAPLMNKWASEYAKGSDTSQVYYLSEGSGVGVNQFLTHSLDFGATDAPVPEQLKDPKGSVIRVPLAIGAVVPTYNVPSLSHAVRLTPELLAGIFLGDVTTWNDPALVEVNPHLELPNTPIVVIHRSDDSGATFELTEYLSKVSATWKAKVGVGAKVPWPTGQAAKGNEGVARMVQQTPGAIGYTELSYALYNRLPVSELRNQAGHFIVPSSDSVNAAAIAENAHDSTGQALSNSAAETAWPISGTTWAVLHRDMTAGPNRDALMSFLRWVVHDGQKECAPLGYAPLPKELVSQADLQLGREPAAR